MTTASTGKPPIWYWILGVVALIWNVIGLFDYYNSISLNEAYLAQTPGWLEYIRDMPWWAKGAWGLATTTAVLGSVALLARRAWASPLFALSIGGMVISFGNQLLAPNLPEMPGWMSLFTLLLFLIAFFLFWFSWKSGHKDWTR